MRDSGKKNKKVVILVNLGSPNRATKYEVYGFLGRFLGDKRIVKIPKILWYPILYQV